MSSTDTASKLRDLLVGQFAPDGNATAVALVDAVLQKSCSYSVSCPLDASINTVSVDTLDTSTALRMKATSFKITALAALTETNTNLATMQLVYNNGNGGTDTVVALAYTNIAGGLGNLVANTPAAFSITAANSIIPAGSCVQIKTTKSGAGGVALSYRSFHLKCTPL